MKFRRLIGVLGATVALAAPTLFVAGTAGAAPGGSVQRFESLTFNVELHVGGGYLHYFTAVLNPSDGSFVGTGYNSSGGNLFETISGTYFDGNLSYYATQYTGTTLATEGSVGVTWWTDSPVAITNGGGSGFSTGSQYFTGSPITVSNLVVTMYANHGAFVSQNPGAASAMSCLGMPIQSMAC